MKDKTRIRPIKVFRTCGCCGEMYVPGDGYSYYLCCECSKISSEADGYGGYSIELKDWDFKGDV